MSTLTLTHRYPQPPSEVFAALNDFAAIHRFHPLLESSPLVEGTPAFGAGSERVCHLHDGNSIHERLVAARADELLTVEVVDSSMPVAKMIADFELAEVLLRNTIQRAMGNRPTLVGPRAVLSAPHGITEVERRAFQESVRAAGARERRWAPSAA